MVSMGFINNVWSLCVKDVLMIDFDFNEGHHLFVILMDVSDGFFEQSEIVLEQSYNMGSGWSSGETKGHNLYKCLISKYMFYGRYFLGDNENVDII